MVKFTIQPTKVQIRKVKDQVSQGQDHNIIDQRHTFTGLNLKYIQDYGITDHMISIHMILGQT